MYLSLYLSFLSLLWLPWHFPRVATGKHCSRAVYLTQSNSNFFHQDRGGGPIVLCINNPFVSSAPTSFSPYGQCDREPRALMMWNSFQTWMARTRHRAHLPNNEISWSIFSNYLVISIMMQSTIINQFLITIKDINNIMILPYILCLHTKISIYLTNCKSNDTIIYRDENEEP